MWRWLVIFIWHNSHQLSLLRGDIYSEKLSLKNGIFYLFIISSFWKESKSMSSVLITRGRWNVKIAHFPCFSNLWMKNYVSLHEPRCNLENFSTIEHSLSKIASSVNQNFSDEVIGFTLIGGCFLCDPLQYHDKKQYACYLYHFSGVVHWHFLPYKIPKK